MTTRVVNRLAGRPVYDVYVGRPSVWGNPYSTKDSKIAEFTVTTLDEALRGYERHLIENEHLIARARRELRGKTLACWCVNDLNGRGDIICHAQILARVADGAELPVIPARSGDLSRLASALKKMGAASRMRCIGCGDYADDAERPARCPAGENTGHSDIAVGEDGMALGADA